MRKLLDKRFNEEYRIWDQGPEGKGICGGETLMPENWRSVCSHRAGDQIFRRLSTEIEAGRLMPR